MGTTFIPEVPDASIGRRGLFSQTSTPLRQVTGHINVVVFEEYQTAAGGIIAGEMDDVLDQLFSGVVLRVRFSRENELNGTVSMV